MTRKAGFRYCRLRCGAESYMFTLTQTLGMEIKMIRSTYNRLASFFTSLVGASASGASRLETELRKGR